MDKIDSAPETNPQIKKKKNPLGRFFMRLKLKLLIHHKSIMDFFHVASMQQDLMDEVFPSLVFI